MSHSPCTLLQPQLATHNSLLTTCLGYKESFIYIDIQVYKSRLHKKRCDDTNPPVLILYLISSIRPKSRITKPPCYIMNYRSCLKYDNIYHNCQHYKNSTTKTKIQPMNPGTKYIAYNTPNHI